MSPGYNLRWPVCILAAVFAILSVILSTSVFGHEVRPAFLKITQLEVSDASPQFEASFRQPQVDGRFLGLSFTSNCEALATGASINEGALIEVWRLNCNDEPLHEVTVLGLERTLIDALVSVSMLDGSVLNRLATAAEPTIQFNAQLPGVPVYLSIGVEHLLLGWDHILFVLLLLYLVQSPMGIVKVVSSFTLAHSLTLALSALNIVQLSQAPVEAIIAASIVLLAWEITRKDPQRKAINPVVVAFSFGLLHGLGFAGALAEIGLPEQGRLFALLLFNVGIEAGQLLIVVVALTFARILTVLLPSSGQENLARFVHGPVVLAGGIACYWFLQRSLDIFANALS